MERETGFEPATSSLGSWHSTTELLPLSRRLKYTKHSRLSARLNSASLRIPDSFAGVSDACLPRILVTHGEARGPETRPAGTRISRSAVSLGLTERRYYILQGVAAGRSNAQLARELNTTVGSVKGTVQSLFLKLEVRAPTKRSAEKRPGARRHGVWRVPRDCGIRRAASHVHRSRKRNPGGPCARVGTTTRSPVLCKCPTLP
jgi:DNA-binding CsgD family transcriptional regulator